MSQGKLVKVCDKCNGKKFVTGIGLSGQRISFDCPKCFGVGKLKW